VPLALYASQYLAQVGFEQVLVDLIKAGGDTDTTASIAGQIMGARIGASRLPEWMKEKLPEGVKMAFESLVMDGGWGL
jgi:ADP-ribosylglycohydrolase